MNQKLLSQLQSRIDIRRNDIRHFENEFATIKAVMSNKVVVAIYGEEVMQDVRDERDNIKSCIKALAKEQKLDKKLYSMALCMEDMIRYNRELTAQVMQPVYVISIDETSKLQPGTGEAWFA